jgi:hypothetical protein
MHVCACAHYPDLYPAQGAVLCDLCDLCDLCGFFSDSLLQRRLFFLALLVRSTLQDAPCGRPFFVC